MSQSTTGRSSNISVSIEKIKANDDTALKQLYTANYYKIEQYILRNNGTVDDAKDVYQEAFLAAWRNIQLDRFQPQDDTSLQGYLFRIAQFKWRDQLRSAGRKHTVPLPVTDLPETETENAREEDEYINKVKLHYQALGEQCRDLLNRFYYLKESLREIANFFSWTEASAKNNKYRCLQKLRALVIAKN